MSAVKQKCPGCGRMVTELYSNRKLFDSCVYCNPHISLRIKARMKSLPRKVQSVGETDRQKYCIGYAREFCRQIGIKRCIVEFRKKENNLGTAYHKENKIILSSGYIEKSHLMLVNALIRHEVLHLKYPGEHHGKNFKRAAAKYLCCGGPISHESEVYSLWYSVMTSEEIASYMYIKYKYNDWFVKS